MLSSQRKALAMVGLSRSVWHYRLNPRPRALDPISHKQRAYPNRIDAADRHVIEARIQAGWARGRSVDHSFAEAWDAGVMVASRRSWWRIAETIVDQSQRPLVPTRAGTRTPRTTPVLVATRPGQVWSWDITDVKSTWHRVTYKAYSIIDIFSRKIVGYRVEAREVDDLAVEMFETAIAQFGAPDHVHADSGAAMKSNALKNALEAHGVCLSHNRPYVSNDNPYSESEFRTMKYRPDYPGTFESLETARAHIDGYVVWYNTEHRHSGIALFTPDQVHDGSWEEVHADRARSLDAYYAAHPERFHTPPRVAAPAGVVGINHETPKVGGHQLTSEAA
ncbi:IS3 family transposase [Brevibacterium metallidurans]|uniref:IS3 family transposase n=1 Tax=Brevibacterium metallidurans TaxID=1482676 RepID=A0ABP3CCQ1_9MICO